MVTSDETIQARRETPQGNTSSNVVETSKKNPSNNNIDELEEDEVFCRLCYGTKYDDSSLIEPCLCKGTVAKVHRQCLEKWLNRIGSKKCELCLFEFECQEKLRYGCFQSIGIWLRVHRRRRFLMHDILLFLTMNVITLSMIALLLQAIYHVYSDEIVKEALPFWYFVALCLAALLWIIIYILTFVVFINTQIRPWYRWWRSVKKINLVTN